jgi:hypothetical protein
MILATIRNFLNLAALTGALNRLPPLHTPVMDLVYPEAVRRNHPFDKLGWEDLGLPSKNIPLVTRGSVSYALQPDKKKIAMIDPANFTPSTTLSAADCNRFMGLGLAGRQQLIDNKIDYLRRSCRKSSEAMAIQSLSGAINYDIRTADGTMDLYNVNFGAIKDVAITKKWDADGTKIGDIVADVGRIVADLKKTSDGGDIIFLVKYDVFAALVTKAASLPAGTDLVKVFPDYVQIGLAKFVLINAQYYSYASKTNVDAIPDKSVVVLARDDSFGFFYCALDSFDANFAALPFYVKAEQLSDPEALKLIGQSRPMPVPNVNAMRKAQVLA